MILGSFLTKQILSWKKLLVGSKPISLNVGNLLWSCANKKSQVEVADKIKKVFRFEIALVLLTTRRGCMKT